jgi:hypothetical protein
LRRAVGLNLDLLAARRASIVASRAHPKDGLALAGYDEYLRAGRVLIFGAERSPIPRATRGSGAVADSAPPVRATFPAF